MVAFCCDLVVSSDVQGVLDLWRDYDEAVERPKWATRAATDAPLDRAAFQRWADAYLPPVAVRAWLDPGGKRILDSDALDMLERRVAIGSDGAPVSEQVWRDAEVLSGVGSLSELIGGLKSAGTKAARNEARTMANPRRASERFERDSSIDLARRRIRAERDGSEEARAELIVMERLAPELKKAIARPKAVWSGAGIVVLGSAGH